QRLHVGLGRRVPSREIHLVALVDDAIAIGVEHQHTIARRRPGRVMLEPVARHVEEHVRRGDRRDLDALAVEIQDDRRGTGAAGTAARSARAAGPTAEAATRAAATGEATRPAGAAAAIRSTGASARAAGITAAAARVPRPAGIARATRVPG